MLEPTADNHQSRIGDTLEMLLSDLPSPLADAIRLGAISHQLSPTLLTHLLDSPLELEQFWTYLVQFQLAKQTAQGEFRYHDRVRTYFLDWWRTHQPQRFYVAQQRALAYFQEQWAAATELQRPLYQYEILYHLLVVDEIAGLAYLQLHFEAALDQYQPGVAEQYLQQGLGLAATLTPATQMWLRYLQARLDLAYDQGDRGATVFQELAATAPTPHLRAVAQWSLGVVLVKEQQWSQAIQLYKTSLTVLRQEKPVFYHVRLLVAIGQAYQDLAEHSGGFLDESDESPFLWHKLWHWVQFFPFLCYQWFVHFIPLLPNWYFGPNYQNWLIAYLLGEAVQWYRLAERQARETAQPWYVIEIRLALAVLEHQVGRWRSAHRRLARLLELEEVQKSFYRTARVHLEQGQALFREARLHEAQQILAPATAVFASVNDDRSYGATTFLLGRISHRFGQLTAAIHAYSTSIEAFTRHNDLVMRTQVTWRLQDLLQEPAVTVAQRQEIRTLLGQTVAQQYISRFPDVLLRRFRRLAVLWIFPLNYLITMFISWWAVQTLFQEVEMGVRLLLTGIDLQFTWQDLLILSAWAISPLIALWLYYFMYCLSGFVVVRNLGRRLAPIEREQPHKITIDRQGFQRQVVGSPVEALTWEQLALFVSSDYYRWRRPLALFSRFVLIPTRPKMAGAALLTRGEAALLPLKSPIMVNAIVMGYVYLRRNLIDFAQGQQKTLSFVNLDLKIFDRNWMFSVSLLCLLIALGLSYGEADLPAHKVQPDGTIITVYLVATPLFRRFVTSFFLIYPVTLLGRLLRQRRSLRAIVGTYDETIPTWLLWTALLVQAGIALLWLITALLN